MVALFEYVTAFVELQGDDDIPRDITGPELLPGADPAPLTLWMWLGPLLLIAALLIAFGTMYYLKPKPRRMTASDRALRQLDRLQALQLLSKNQAERHFTLLAGILRRFIEKVFGITAARATTSEFLEAAARNPSMERHLSFLREFLSASDIAKFAPPAAAAAVDRDLDGKLRTWLGSQTGEMARRT
jgi:hypothetical protein